ncbi:paraslipin [Leptolyngbya sp. FACHB-36]|nr:paraslipin [Leptolyngbya sp. FACHB-36]
MIAAIVLAIIGYIFGSVRIIKEGTNGVVERLGRFERVLEPGLNFVVPVLDRVLEESTREQTIDIPPQSAITQDNASVTVDAIVFFRIKDVYRANYSVEDLEDALENLVITTLRSEVGKLTLRDAVSSRDKINRAVLNQLDQATEAWGAKVIRVEVQEIQLPPELRQAMDAEMVAESRRKAAISESQGTVQSIQLISDALKEASNAKAVLQYLVAKSYVDANYKLGESNNSKIIFMDPKALTETVGELIAADNNEGMSGNENRPS